ncbi:MAG: class I SAM-dependent methyltransferase [Parvularculaceae bacterium]
MTENAWDDYWRDPLRARRLEGIDTGVAAHPAIGACWERFFSSLDASALHAGPGVLDVGCGAGALSKRVFEFINREDISGCVIGLDYAPAAVAALRNSGAEKASARFLGVAADAARLPFADQSIGVAVSQFGAEYAGMPAFDEIARVLMGGGALGLMCHIRGGVIETECRRNLGALDAVLDGGVVAAMEQSFSDAPSAADIDAAGRKLSQLQKDLAALPTGEGLTRARRLAGDLVRLHLRRASFAAPEVQTWLRGTKADLESYRTRMSGMIAAALDADQVAAICENWRQGGLDPQPAEPLHLDEGAPPAAWFLRARRP